MAPASGRTRNRRTHRPRTAAASTLPRGRVPVSRLPSPRASAFASHSHINIVTRHPDEFSEDEEGATDISETPTHINPSLLAGLDAIVDQHRQSSESDIDRTNATFADMARAGLGMQWRPDHMVSHEPVGLDKFMKFPKHRSSKAGISPFDDDIAVQSATSVTGPSQAATQNFGGGNSTFNLASNNTFTSSTTNTYKMPLRATNQPTYPQGQHPIDALGQHFVLVKNTFGRALPSQHELRGTEGQRDGEVQFTIDAGGDIIAHCWSAAQFQWLNVGCFSYRRNAIEGSIAVCQLKGQKIGSMAPRNQVEHFHALAKQYEEERFLAALSPTSSLDTSNTRARQMPDSQPIVLPAPQPKRPAATFKIGQGFEGSISSAGVPSQQIGLPAMNSLYHLVNTTSITPHDTQASFIGLPPPAVSARNSSASPTHTNNKSPLQRQYAPLTTANTSLERSQMSACALSLSTESSMSEADLIKQQQTQIWQQEREMRMRHPTNVEASREPIYGDTESMFVFSAAGAGASSYAPVPLHYYQKTSNTLTPSPKKAAIPHPHLFNAGNKFAWSEATVRPSQVGKTTDDRFSWGNLVQSRVVGSPGSLKASKQQMHSDAGESYSSLMQDPTGQHTSISSIGHSQADDTFMTRRPIWSSQTLQSPQDKGDAYKSSFALSNRGPFFTADKDNMVHKTFDLDWGDVDEQGRPNDLGGIRSTHKSMLERKAMTLTRNHVEVEKLSTDPRSHVLFAVMENLKSYQDTPPEQGDYFQRQWSEADPRLVDLSAKGDASFFAESKLEKEAEEVVFRGRKEAGSSDGTSSVIGSGRGKEKIVGQARAESMRPAPPLGSGVNGVYGHGGERVEGGWGSQSAGLRSPKMPRWQ